MDFWLPEESSGEIVTLDQLEAPPVAAAVRAWRQDSGTRAFPASPDGFIGNPHVFVVRILDQGTDYEYASVGAELIKGFDEDFSGRRLSSIVATNPRFGIGLRMLYDMVRSSGEPLGYRGWVGRDMKGARFNYHENAVLPFGATDARVEHLVVATALVPRNLPPPPRNGDAPGHAGG
ncbi:MAG: hypothetical protein H6924_08780 [Alphaproteobacteria bacterium]|nr:hypothetical protein [Alphaproteobacteria bacterium]